MLSPAQKSLPHPSPSNGWSSRFAHDFKSEALSDAELVIRVAPRGPTSGVKRTKDDAALARFPAHKIVLLKEPYFARQAHFEGQAGLCLG